MQLSKLLLHQTGLQKAVPVDQIEQVKIFLAARLFPGGDPEMPFFGFG
jgi:hypothetical protein